METIQPEDIFAIGFAVIIVFGFIAVLIFFLLAQQNILKAIQPENRLMRPGEVWLQLIPIFGTVWQFIVVNRISDSIVREIYSWQNDSAVGDPDYEMLQMSNSRPTRDVGIAFCILGLFNWIPIISIFTGIAWLICWIIYWVKLAEYKRTIERRTRVFNITSGV